MIDSPSVECIWPAETILGEAPAWCPKEQVVYWVDIEGKTILRMNPQSGDRRIFPQDYEFGCIVKRADGGFIAGTNAGLVHLDADLKSSTIFATPETGFPNNRFNDGKCDRRGRYRKLLAFYHSHTNSQGYPSSTDVRMAQQSGWLGKDIYYVVVSLKGKATPYIKAYRIQENGDIVEEEIETT